MSEAAEWTPGLPPGRYYPGMEREYEVYFSPGGRVWHRRIRATTAPPSMKEEGE